MWCWVVGGGSSRPRWDHCVSSLPSQPHHTQYSKTFLFGFYSYIILNWQYSSKRIHIIVFNSVFNTLLEWILPPPIGALNIMIFLQWGSTICNDPPAQCNAQMKALQHCIECSGINYSCAQRNTVQRSEEPGAVNQNTFHCRNTAVQKTRCSDQRFSF